MSTNNSKFRPISPHRSHQIFMLIKSNRQLNVLLAVTMLNLIVINNFTQLPNKVNCQKITNLSNEPQQASSTSSDTPTSAPAHLVAGSGGSSSSDGPARTWHRPSANLTPINLELERRLTSVEAERPNNVTSIANRTEPATLTTTNQTTSRPKATSATATRYTTISSNRSSQNTESKSTNSTSDPNLARSTRQHCQESSAIELCDSRSESRVARNFAQVRRRPTKVFESSAEIEVGARVVARQRLTAPKLRSQSTGHKDSASAPVSVLSDVVDASESNHVEHNQCALILKRTIILRQDHADEWGEKFVFNDIDTDSEKARVQKSDLCIKYSDVDKAFEEARHHMKFKRPTDLDSYEVSPQSISQVSELNLAIASNLKKRFDLSHDELLNALPMIDVSQSQFYTADAGLCPRHVRPMGCSKSSRYRTITAHCNNLKHPSWGATSTPYARYLPPDYADGLDKPRAGRDGKPLPSARLITSIVHVDHDEPSHDHSHLFADWGQLLNHDITRVAVGSAPDCCPAQLKGLCMPIPVPEDDPLYSDFNVKCLKFDRALAAVRPKCLIGLRAQINTITSVVDASFVYGSTNSQARALRTFDSGKMKVWNFFDKPKKLKPLLPPKMDDPDQDCLARPKNLFCFIAGDVRVNEQTHLTVLHTLYLREHNRIADKLAQINMEWDDEKIYQETRHIVAAGVQHVMANEFLPLLLGHSLVSQYKLKPMADGFWNGYDPSVTMSTGTAFSSAAFRFGHSMIEGIIRRLEPHSGTLIKSQLLRFLFKRPFMLFEPGAIDQLITGMVLSPAEQTDPFVSEELSGHLFQPPKAKFGHDLAAINIQRGRDLGVPGYNEWREWCGLSRAKSFADLEPLLMNRTAWQYARIYKHVDDVDLWSAGISERKLPGLAVGPTMACIIARQFLNYKRGDRFWYENPFKPSAFSAEQLREIKKVTLAKILCANSDNVKHIQPWAMRLPHPIYNARVPCESLPSMNLNHWDSNNVDF